MRLRKCALGPLLCSVLLAGCATSETLTVAPIDYPRRADKIELRIGLSLTRELTEAKWSDASPGSTRVGALVAAQTQTLAPLVFREVVMITDGNARPADVDAVLTPRLLYAHRAPAPNSVAVKVEWRLLRLTGEPIWLESMGTRSSGDGGDAEHLQKALQTIFLASEQSMSTARSIREFAARVRRADRPASPVATIASTSGTTAASPIVASLPPGARALVGTWTGTLTLPRTPGSTGSGDRRRVVEVVIAELGGAIQWTMTGPGSVQLASGSASLADDGGAVLVGVFAREAGRLAGTPVQYHLRVLDRRLDGSGLTGSNEIQELSLTR